MMPSLELDTLEAVFATPPNVRRPRLNRGDHD
jgi:hypothetical protein